MVLRAACALDSEDKQQQSFVPWLKDMLPMYAQKFVIWLFKFMVVMDI